MEAQERASAISEGCSEQDITVERAPTVLEGCSEQDIPVERAPAVLEGCSELDVTVGQPCLVYHLRKGSRTNGTYDRWAASQQVTDLCGR